MDNGNFTEFDFDVEEITRMFLNDIRKENPQLLKGLDTSVAGGDDEIIKKMEKYLLWSC